MNPTENIGIQSSDQADSVWVLRDHLKFMGHLAGTDWHVVEIEVPPGSGTPPHTHASPEIFRVLSGVLTFGQFGEGPPRFHEAGTGVVVTVPSMAAHNYQNLSGEPASMLVVLEESMVRFFRDIGTQETPPEAPPSPEEIEALLAGCARHDIAILS